MFTLSKFFFLNPGKYLPYPEDFRKTKIGIWSMWKQLEELLKAKHAYQSVKKSKHMSFVNASTGINLFVHPSRLKPQPHL